MQPNLSSASFVPPIKPYDDAKYQKEAELVTQTRAGDENAFADLVKPYMPKIYRLALRIARNREDAEDISQQALLKAYTHIGQFHGDARFSTWVTRITINEGLMKMRKRRNEESHFCDEVAREEGTSAIDKLRAGESFHPDNMFSRRERKRALRKAIDSLRSTSRAVVWMLGLEEKRSKEVAQRLNMSEAAVKAQFMRARYRLRECLTDRV
ncbi:MAG: RNA polymerase sigma factor [Candidatus Acidiferrales bacterium]